MSRISVITVCFNAAATIEQTLKSVAEQTHDDLEYVIIDGASTDHTLDIIERYRDSVDVLVSEPDRGLYDAMNKGIEKASGDALIFLNADDRFHDAGVVADAAAAFDRDPALDLVYGEVLLDFGDRLDDQWKQHPVLDRRALCLSTVSHQCQFTSAGLFARTGGFNEQYKVVADLDWLYRAVVGEGARTRHIDRLISIVGMAGITGGSSSWTGERDAWHRAHYTARERFLWRIWPRHIVAPLGRLHLDRYHIQQWLVHRWARLRFEIGRLLGRGHKPSS